MPRYPIISSSDGWQTKYTCVARELVQPNDNDNSGSSSGCSSDMSVERTHNDPRVPRFTPHGPPLGPHQPPLPRSRSGRESQRSGGVHGRGVWRHYRASSCCRFVRFRLRYSREACACAQAGEQYKTPSRLLWPCSARPYCRTKSLSQWSLWQNRESSLLRMWLKSSSAQNSVRGTNSAPGRSGLCSDRRDRPAGLGRAWATSRSLPGSGGGERGRDDEDGSAGLGDLRSSRYTPAARSPPRRLQRRQRRHRHAGPLSQRC